MFNRRDVLKGFAAGAVGAVTGCSLEGPVADASLVDIVKAEKFPSVDGKPLINKPRAYQVLEEENIDGLVALIPSMSITSPTPGLSVPRCAGSTRSWPPLHAILMNPAS